MRFSRIGLVGVAAVLGLAALACGGDDDDSGSGDREALIAKLTASQAESDDDFSEDQVECMVPGMIDAIGVDKLVEAGALEDESEDVDFGEMGLDLSDEQAGDLYDAMADCVDLRAEFIAGMTEDGDATEEQAQCLSDAVDDDLFKRLIVTSMVEGEDALDADEELVTAFTDAAESCMAAG